MAYLRSNQLTAKTQIPSISLGRKLRHLRLRLELVARSPTLCGADAAPEHDIYPTGIC